LAKSPFVQKLPSLANFPPPAREATSISNNAILGWGALLGLATSPTFGKVAFHGEVALLSKAAIC
jgi:hypothetical protein